MARNKYPEQTVDLILDVAFRLFMEKGYEHTSIQDIIDNLGGLSKGAIYHHFKSKEDILIAVLSRMTAESNQNLAAIRDRSDMSGKEKLKTIFKESLLRSVQSDIFTVMPKLGDSPQLVYSMLRDSVEESAPLFIKPIIEQGIADGTIQAEHAAALAELIVLAANIWLNPMIFNSSVEETYRKVKVFDQMLQGFGLDILDEETSARLEELAAIYQENK